MLAIVDYLAREPGVDADRIGLIGVSQAGWIMPLAAARSEAVAFFISISGAASAVGVSDHYDDIAEDLDSGAITEALAAFDEARAPLRQQIEDAEDTQLIYRLQTAVPRNWIPFVPVGAGDEGEVVLERRALRRTPVVPRRCRDAPPARH